MKYAACLNDAGQAHVAAELRRLGLDWDVSATCSEIEGSNEFMGLQPGEGEAYNHEIRNISAGKSGYGAFGCIEILADDHVEFVDLEDSE